MAGSVNKVILIGHLGKDPEIRTAQNGTRFASFSIATGESWKDRVTGEKKERTEWHNVVIVSAAGEGGLVSVAERYLRKGSKVYVEGELRTRKWQDKAGNDRWSTEVVLSGPKAGLTLLDKSDGAGPGKSDYSGYDTGAGGSAPPPGDLDDEVPF